MTSETKPKQSDVEVAAEDFAQNHSELMPITSPKWTKTDLDLAVEKSSKSGFEAGVAWRDRWVLEQIDALCEKENREQNYVHYKPSERFIYDLKKLLEPTS